MFVVHPNLVKPYCKHITQMSKTDVLYFVISLIISMVLLLDGYSEIGAHVKSIYCFMISFWQLIRSRAVTNRTYSPKTPVFLHTCVLYNNISTEYCVEGCVIFSIYLRLLMKRSVSWVLCASEVSANLYRNSRTSVLGRLRDYLRLLMKRPVYP